MNVTCRTHNRFTRTGLLLFAGTLLAAPFDKTTPPWPQLSTSRGPIKSGGKIKEAVQGSIDMLLTDMPMTDGELQQVRERRGVRLLHIATAVTGVVPCYNLAGLEVPLNFSSDILAGIFRGEICKWNDPAILALNSSVHLPHTDIVIIGHAMEDGSTYAFTDFLSKTNENWRLSIGRVRSIIGVHPRLLAEHSEDIAELVKRTPNSVSFTEAWAAKQRSLQIARVRNHSGRFVDATPASLVAAAETASSRIRDDFRTSITDMVGIGDYPIASFTWVVIPETYGDSEKSAVVLAFLKWVLTEGQGATESMNLAPLPRVIAEREINAIDSLH